LRGREGRQRGLCRAQARCSGHTHRALGDDDLAEQALNPLRRIGFDLRYVLPVPGVATGFVTIVVTPDGKKTMIAAPNANDVWTSEETASAASAIDQSAANSIVVADCAIAIEPVEHAARAARRRNFTLILDPSPAERVPERLFPLVHLATANPVEAEELTWYAFCRYTRR
jgi:ribokinase